MWNALKTDLFDFVNTIQSDTANTLQKVLGEDNEEKESEQQSVLEKLRADLKRSYETYGNAVKESKINEFEKYKKKFSLSGFAKEIAQVLDEEPEVSRFYAELVPVEISPEEFWARLFFRLHLLNRNGSSTFEDDEDDENLVWEAEEDDQPPASEEPAISTEGDSENEILRVQLRKKDEEVTLLIRDNEELKKEVIRLNLRIQELERLHQQALPLPVLSPANNQQLAETASISSSDGSLLVVSHETVRLLEEGDGGKIDQKPPVSNTVPLAALDDEDEEDGWS